MGFYHMMTKRGIHSFIRRSSLFDNLSSQRHITKYQRELHLDLSYLSSRCKASMSYDTGLSERIALPLGFKICPKASSLHWDLHSQSQCFRPCFCFGPYQKPGIFRAIHGNRRAQYSKSAAFKIDVLGTEACGLTREVVRNVSESFAIPFRITEMSLKCKKSRSMNLIVMQFSCHTIISFQCEMRTKDHCSCRRSPRCLSSGGSILLHGLRVCITGSFHSTNVALVRIPKCFR
jgi:hypothetical protein